MAPFSWLARSDVDEARAHLDFSAWNGRVAGPALQRALDHDMPPWPYALAHPEARLSDGQKQLLAQGFQASLAAQGKAGEPGPGNQAGDPGPAPTRAALARAALTRVSFQPGAEGVINGRCGSCHSPRRAMDCHASSPARAKALIARMVRHGAKLPAADELLLIDRFTR